MRLESWSQGKGKAFGQKFEDVRLWGVEQDSVESSLKSFRCENLGGLIASDSKHDV